MKMSTIDIQYQTPYLESLALKAFCFVVFSERYIFVQRSLSTGK
jgi:hypothetical protein